MNAAQSSGDFAAVAYAFWNFSSRSYVGVQVVKWAPFGVSTTPATMVRLSSRLCSGASTVSPAVSMICSVET